MLRESGVKKVNEKEKTIIEAAIKLFAQKGFTSTSIQEIAARSGISKGAFYLHFKSKEALLLAILQFYFEKLKAEVLSYENKELSAKEVFIKQLAGFLKNSIEHHEFIIMISREQTIPLNDSTKKLIYKMQMDIHEIYHKAFIDIFGKKVEPYVWDLSVMAEGILSGYIKILLFNKEKNDLDQLAEFIYHRIEAIYKDLAASKEKPALSEEVMMQLLFKTKAFIEKDTGNIIAVIDEIKRELIEQEIFENKEDLLVSLEVMEAELSRQTPRSAVLQGMLSNFNGLPNFSKRIHAIAAYVKEMNK